MTRFKISQGEAIFKIKQIEKLIATVVKLIGSAVSCKSYSKFQTSYLAAEQDVIPQF